MSKLTNITHPNFRCTFGACPAVYTDRTPESSRCVGGTCPAVLDDDSGNFIFIGERLDPVPEELAGKVGETEAAVSLPVDLVLASLGVAVPWTYEMRRAAMKDAQNICDLVEAAKPIMARLEDEEARFDMDDEDQVGVSYGDLQALSDAVNRIKGGA